MSLRHTHAGTFTKDWKMNSYFDTTTYNFTVMNNQNSSLYIYFKFT